MYQAVNDLRDLDAAHILHGLYDPTDRDQLTILIGGDGAVVRDVGGREFLDGISCLWNLNLGLGRDELVDAAAEQMKKLAYSCTYSGFGNIPAIELAARLSSVAYEGLTATFFTASGADANECAFKTARFYWKRQGKRDKVKILSLENGYHGVTLAAMSATGIPAYWPMFQPRIPEFIHVPSPNPYRCNFAAAGEDPGTAAARLLEEAIRHEGPDNVAAFIAEPVQGAGGVMVPPDNYFPLVREICNRYDVLLIADEVITGFGRTGRWFALSHWGVEPDIMTFAKGVTSAYLPLGGMMVTKKIADAISGAPPSERWMHASTYSGHPVCCAVALRTLVIMEREKLVDKAARLGRYMLRRLEALLELESVGDIRGLGLMAGVELVADRTTKAPFDRALKVGDRIRQKAHQAGLIIRNRGDIINIAPPFVISEDQLDALVSILRDAITDTTRGLL
jgi:adenosylmethionine-8-amino-7-oxononanoate aminotransferase